MAYMDEFYFESAAMILTLITVPKGAIALQSEGGAVQFRNVWVED